MGADPSAILYYGVDLGAAAKEAYVRMEYDDHEMNEAWQKDHQPKQPNGENYRTPEWDDWRAKNEAYEKTPEFVEMDWSGSEHGQNYYVHCPCLKREVEWDEQEDLGNAAALGHQPEADRWIREFCERFKLPFKQPTWHLAARYF